MKHEQCQLCGVSGMGAPLAVSSIIWQRLWRLKRIIRRRIRFLHHFIFRRRVGLAVTGVPPEAEQEKLKPGDQVRVRSLKEIEATLDGWNQLKHCAFMDEMVPYCGTRQTVLKPVRKFLDERDYLVKKCGGLVVLNGVLCEGTRDFGACDRSCFFFWREEWLERIR